MKNPIKYTLSRLIGSGITEKLPFLRKIYDKSYSRIYKNKYKIANIPLELKLKYSLSDTGIGAFLNLKGEYEPFQTKLILTDLDQVSCFLDVGANIGYYSMLAGGKGKRVLSFEPDDFNYSLLQENKHINNLTNINLYKIALGNFNGSIGFTSNVYQRGGSEVDENSEVKVNIRTLDSILGELNHTPELIKIDIEGFEIDFLKGGFVFLKKYKPILYIEFNPKSLISKGHDPKVLIDILDQMKYKIQVIDEKKEKLTFFTPSEVLSTTFTYTNFRCS